MRTRRMSSTLAPIALLALAAPLAAEAPQQVNVTAPDGVGLRATYWPAAKSGPGVLLLPMCNTTRKSWNGLGPLLAARGIHALALDYRGFGESGGERSSEVAVRQRAEREIWPGDIDAAFALLVTKTGLREPILGAAGGSCGVNQAVMLARRHPEVRTLALLAGVSDREGETFLAANPWMPILGVASRDDGNAVETTRWLIGFSSHPGNEIKEYAEGGHGTELFAGHPELEPAIADWFTRHLVSAPVRRAAPSRRESGGPSAALSRELAAPGAAAAIRARIAAERSAGRSPELPGEAIVNRIGYQLLASGQAARAVELFALNTELYPESANAYDSLSEAQAELGQRALAAASAMRALELLPADPATDTPLQKSIREAARSRIGAPAPPGGG